MQYIPPSDLSVYGAIKNFFNNAAQKRKEFEALGGEYINKPNSLKELDLIKSLAETSPQNIQTVKEIETAKPIAATPAEQAGLIPETSSYNLPEDLLGLNVSYPISNFNRLQPYIPQVIGVAAPENTQTTPSKNTQTTPSTTSTVNPAKSQVPPASTEGAKVSGSYRGIKGRTGRGGTTTEGNKREPKEIPKNSYNTPNNSLTTNDYSWFDALLPLLAAGGLGYLLNRR